MVTERGEGERSMKSGKAIGEGDEGTGDVSSLGKRVRGQILRVCLTGGPCGGKTTVQGFVAEEFERMGWRVFRSPEVATIILGGGVKYAEMNEDRRRRFQVDVLNVMMRIEDVYNGIGGELASRGENVIVIYDRGVMDCSAYLDKDEWRAVCSEAGVCSDEVRDKRYDCVIHLVSAAEGAPLYYGRDNNSARSEDISKALALEKRTREGWRGHRRVEVIDNSTDFEGKKRRVVEAILKYARERGDA
ncbi:thymidylate kinase [Encephalitozoon hellem]|uniref:Thymidylate kinase n=1 Tax=Encephalitozoon hellem TaxID=27973 RepID=A0A9Q9C5V6_ENCHE|nr:thymidylate kinase [Encephalitozoon hellem]UTX43092.1 tyumidylate kinase [Encephalitozoon hellem]UTX43289.1 thymidylate kinase [Encephalitozoon hellem]